MTAKTPGPWIWNPRTLSGAVVRTATGKKVAEVSNGDDAELIAAAPDLLEAAETALGLSAIWTGEHLRLTSIEHWDMAHDQLRQAIARARGEA